MINNIPDKVMTGFSFNQTFAVLSQDPLITVPNFPADKEQTER